MKDREDISTHLEKIASSLFWIHWQLILIVLVLTWK